MNSKKSFWLSLVTLGVLSLFVWVTPRYLIETPESARTIYACAILLAVILLAPIVYRNYKKRRSSPKLTRDDYLKRAFLTGGIAVAYSILAFFHPEYRHGSSMNWMIPIGWTVTTVIHLWNASKAEKTRYIPNE